MTPNGNKKRKANPIQQDDTVAKKPAKHASDLFEPLHAAFWKKALDSKLRKLNVDSTTFHYLPIEVLDDLNLAALGYVLPLLLFGEEYATALAMLTSWKKPRTTGVVVTGHPGIGKTYFSLYVLLNRLSLGLPTAIQFGEDVILFTDDGPISYDGHGIISFPSGTWALTDSGSDTDLPCFAFRRSRRSDVFLVQTTSPQLD